MNMVEIDHINSYLRAAMKKYELEQARMSVGRSDNHPPKPETDMPDVDINLVGFRLSRSHDHDRERRDQGNTILQQVATAGDRMVVDSLPKGFECLLWPSRKSLPDGRRAKKELETESVR